MAQNLVLAIDPGEHIGLACYDDEGVLHWDSIMDLDSFIKWSLAAQGKYSVVVIESYRGRPGKMAMQTGSKFAASQAVGAAKVFAASKKAKVVMQDPGILNIAAMHAGIKRMSHYPDNVSAKLHGRWYLESIGVLKPLLQS